MLLDLKISLKKVNWLKILETLQTRHLTSGKKNIKRLHIYE